MFKPGCARPGAPGCSWLQIATRCSSPALPATCVKQAGDGHLLGARRQGPAGALPGDSLQRHCHGSLQAQRVVILNAGAGAAAWNDGGERAGLMHPSTSRRQLCAARNMAVHVSGVGGRAGGQLLAVSRCHTHLNFILRSCSSNRAAVEKHGTALQRGGACIRRRTTEQSPPWVVRHSHGACQCHAVATVAERRTADQGAAQASVRAWPGGRHAQRGRGAHATPDPSAVAALAPATPIRCAPKCRWRAAVAGWRRAPCTWGSGNRMVRCRATCRLAAAGMRLRAMQAHAGIAHAWGWLQRPSAALGMALVLPWSCPSPV